MFSPRFIYNVFAWVKNVPYFWEAGTEYAPELVMKYFFIKLLSCFLVNWGMSFYERRKAPYVRYHFYQQKQSDSYLPYYRIGVFLFILGFAIKMYSFYRAGGIYYIVTHFQNRRTLMAGLHYQELFANTFLTCSALCTEIYSLYTKTKKSKFVFFFIFLMTFACLALFGARKPSIMFLVQVTLCYHFCYKQITFRSLFKPSSMLAILFLVFFIVMMPLLRQSSSEAYFDDPSELIEDTAGNVDNLFREFSYLSGDMYVLEHFNFNNMWAGRSYLNILVQWIPRSLYPQKPPMDDGMYLYNMMCGVHVTPNQSTESLYYQSSIPFTLEGALFSNFGWFGILFGCFLIGILYQWLYKILKDCQDPLLMVFIYQEVILVFVPSVLHTTSTLIAIGVYSIVLVPLFKIRIRRESLIKKRFIL